MNDRLLLEYNPREDVWVADTDFIAGSGDTPSEALRDLADEYQWHLSQRDIRDMEETHEMEFF